MKRILTLWLAVMIWAGIIFFLSSIPGLSSGLEYDHILRKIAHVLEYLILTFFLLYRTFKGTFKPGVLIFFFYPAICSFSYAVSDEIHQTFVLYRHGSMDDVLIDSIGIIGFYLFMKFLPFIKKILLNTSLILQFEKYR